MICIGIDNGLNGGIVAIDEKQDIILKTRMPVINGKRKEYNIPEIIQILKTVKKDADKQNQKISAVLEKTLILPVSGRISIFSTGFCFGMFQGILSTFEIPYQVARPQDWQKEILKGMNLKDTKQMSILWCKRKFPSETWTATDRSTKDHDGLCDATCMAHYAYILNR